MTLKSRTIAFIFLAILLVTGKASTLVAQPVNMARSVQFIYIVPSGKEFHTAYQRGIESAALSIQSWLARKLDGSTFELATPLVTIIRSEKTASWFAGDATENVSTSFYRIASAHLQTTGVIRFNDPNRRYVVYVDADHKCGQSGAGGNGVAIMSANDLRGLSGVPIVPACLTANSAEVQGKCRWIGGTAHELLHTFGLSHSDKQESCRTTECQMNALMMFGYVRYPEAVLLDTEVKEMLRSGFINRQSSLSAADACR